MLRIKSYEEYRSLLTELYVEYGKSIATISKETGLSRSVVHTAMKRLKIPIRKLNKPRVSRLDSFKDDIINDYCEKKLTTIEIAQKLNTYPSKIHDKLLDWGIATRNNSDVLKAKIDEDYFEVINSEERAYWLGFLYADGYVTNKNVIGIALGIKDLSHLKKFKEALDIQLPINFYKTSGYSNSKYGRLKFTNKKMATDLISHGCVNNKSLILEFPNNDTIPNELVRHFIRGYFDGDGSIVFTVSDKNLKLCGTKEFLSEVVNQLNNSISEYNFKQKLYKRRNDKKNSYYLSYGGANKTFAILKWLYSDSKIYLDRKYKIYLQYKNYISRA